MKLNQHNKTSLLVTTAVLTALTLICTLVIRIPVGADCYIHLGDAVIVLATLILPLKYALFVGTIGATLADLIGGYAYWAPFTFVIKLTMSITLSFFINISHNKATNKKHVTDSVLHASNSNLLYSSITQNHTLIFEILGMILASIFNILGYFFSEYILFGSWIPAAACIPFNIIQSLTACLVAKLIQSKSTILQ